MPGVAIPLYGVPQQLVHTGVVQGEESLLQGRIVKLLDHFESCEGLTEAEGEAESFAKLFGQKEVGQLLLLNHQFGFCCLKRDKNVIKIFSQKYLEMKTNLRFCCCSFRDIFPGDDLSIS